MSWHDCYSRNKIDKRPVINRVFLQRSSPVPYRKTYLNWYKNRMGNILDPETYSLMSSCVSEPWDLLQKHKTLLGEDEFNKRFLVSNAYGLPSLIERISACYSVPRKNILLTQGVTSAIFLLTQMFTEAGDHVVAEKPGYEPLHLTPELCNADVGFVTRRSDRPFNIAEFVTVLRSNTRLIILTNPHNPSGKTLTDKDVFEILDRMKQISPEAVLVMDEIYRDFEPEKTVPASMIDDRIISVSSLTKAYGLSVLRCGWIFATPEYLNELRRIQVLMTGIGSRYLEAISTIVFDNIDEYRYRSKQIVDENKHILRSGLRPLFEQGYITGVIPDQGCICFLRINNVSDTRILTDWFEKHYRLFCVPGEFFGDSQCVRMGIGEISPERLKKALALFQTGLVQFMASQTD
jgi:aspartate/methionine/tyrosine aminotransferase